MSDCYIEQRHLKAGTSLSWDIARHLYARLLVGKAAVVTPTPSGLRSAVSKQWLQILRQLHVQRASTLDTKRIWELTQYMKHLEAATLSAQDMDADVVFLSVEQCAAIPLIHPTLYLTQPAMEQELPALTRQMPPGSVVVIYT